MKIYKVEKSITWEGTHQCGYFTNYPSVEDISKLELYTTHPDQVHELVENGSCTVSYYTVYSIVEQKVTEN